MKIASSCFYTSISLLLKDLNVNNYCVVILNDRYFTNSSPEARIENRPTYPIFRYRPTLGASLTRSCLSRPPSLSFTFGADDNENEVFRVSPSPDSLPRRFRLG
ncbi:hypothetical protein AVEN_176353-1 [Araneus ventricosus]|uniref:Uncharacterized protein n=1 Tax=Araneus ventricosus TaxID=182803 RepID=A0A4Y2C6T8_ARAVE|nr:hypothetical protein AVEN_176353-1 [Araneus ventricosus]